MSPNRNASNTLHTILLILAMALLSGLVGFVLGGRWGLMGAAFLAAFGLIAGSRASAALVLRMYKAQPLSPQQSPQLFKIYNELCRRAELSPYPQLYYIPSKMPNAFAVGVGDSSAVALTDGIIRTMSPRELAGIIAHELTHVQYRDTSVLGVADVFTRTISTLSRTGLLMMFFSLSSMFGNSTFSFLIVGAVLFFAPTAAVMLQLALSRTREFNADRGAAELTGDPHGLASALKKIDRMAKGGFLRKLLGPGMRRQQPAMLRTHPPTKDRVEALMEIAEQIEQERSTLPAEMIPQQRRIAPEDQPRVRERQKYHFLSGIWR